MAVDNELEKYFSDSDGGGQPAQPKQESDPLSRYFEEQPKAEQPAGGEAGIERYFEEGAEKPTRVGAIGRAVAEEFVPATAAGLAVSAISKLPLPAVPKFLVGATGAILSAGVAGRGQEAVARKVVGPEAVEQFKAQRERDITQYPVSTFAASALTPTVAALAGLGKKGIGAAGGAIRKAFTKAEQATPEVAGAEKAVAGATESIPVQQELPLGIAPAEGGRAKLIEEVKARAEPGQKMRATAERLLGDAKTPEELAQKIADKRNRALYNTYSPQTLAKNLRVLSPEDRAVIAQGDDLVGNAAKIVSTEDARLAGNVQAADAMFDNVFEKITNAGQMLNLVKLINTTPDGYAYMLSKTLLKASRQFVSDLEKSGAEKASKITEDLRKQAVDLFTKKQAAEAAYNEAKLAARKDLSARAGKLAEEAENKALEASYELASFEARLLTKDLGQQASDYIKGNLLTTISQGANILGNTVNIPARAATRQVASFLDQLERNVVKPIVTRLPGGKGFAEKYLAGEKQFVSPIGKGSLERFLEVGKAGGRGVKEGVVGLKRGISAEGLLAGEDIRGFQPLQAWRQLFTGKGLAQPIATGAAGTAARTMDKVRLLSEGTLGIAPEVMFRLLQLGDAPARRMAQARLLSEQAQLRGLRGEALKRAVRFPLQEEVDKIAQEAAEAVYQQDTQLSRGIKWLTGLIPGYLENIPGPAGKAAAGAARAGITAVIPYQKTPTNVIDEILEYAIPEYSFVKGLAEQGQGKFRSAKLKFAKSIVGWGIGNVADMLSNAGVITSGASKSEKVRDVQLASEGSKMLNLTGSQRFMESGERQETRPGDTLVSLERLGVVGAIMSTRNAARQATEGGSGSVGEAWAATLPQTLKFGFEQSFLRNMNSLLGAISRGEAKDIDSWLANYYSALSSAVIPNQVSAYSRYLSRNMPDKMMAKDIPGSDFATKSLNIFKEVIKRKLPRDAGDIASRINVWGQPIPQTPEGVDPFIYNFIDPTKTRKATYDDLTLAVYDLYKKTNQTEGIPQVPNRELDVVKRRTGQKARYRLDPFLYEEYARQVGKANRQVAEDLFSSREFRRLDPYAQVKQLENSYRAASKAAREAFIRKNQRSIEAGQEL